MSAQPVLAGQSTSPGRKRRKQNSDGLPAALPWIGPVLLLIFAIVIFPAGFMIYNSTREISQSGIDQAPQGSPISLMCSLIQTCRACC
ncbi:hypothetical protein [Arthrobacter sp. Bz4]|uniref:hypothetical protein n=1 Tax=Arthrobacter sp. Bz4 TaxID=2171979 RepID=UPI001FAFE666|nr:hypothetical protein [Arthrobacter sp. Bz4]